VAAAVIAQQPEVLRQRRDLLVPHMQIGAERVRQHQHRRAFRALDLGVNNAAVVGLDIWH